MKRFFLLLNLLIIGIALKAQTIYSKAYGDPKSTPILFLHGGPGYNCVNFEVSTAQKLADNGFYVVVYDRRGEGRSKELKADFTFKQTFDDINDLCKKHKLKKPNIIGHSFGGMVGTLYAKAYPKKINSLILVGAPINLQQSFKTIIESSRKIYEANKDSNSLFYLNMLEKMDTTTMEYASYCFMNAMKNGFYSPKEPTDNAKKLYQELGSSELYGVAKEMTTPAPQGFSKNEKYTTIDLSGYIKDLVNKKMKVYGLYGQEDGLYSAQQVIELNLILGSIDNLAYFDHCSHSIFMDQQDKFIDALKKWLK